MDFRCQWCERYTSNIVDLQMHIFDCSLVDSIPTNPKPIVAVSAEPTSETRIENTQEFNILLEVMEDDTLTDQASHSSGDESLSLNSDGLACTTDEFDQDEMEEMMRRYSMSVLNTDEEDEVQDKEDEEKEKDQDEGREGEHVIEGKKGIEECGEQNEKEEDKEREANAEKEGEGKEREHVKVEKKERADEENEEKEKEKEGEKKEANAKKEHEGKEKELVKEKKEESAGMASEVAEKGQKREEKEKTEVDYADVLQYLETKEKEEIEHVREEARRKISEVERKMVRCQQEVNAANVEFEKEKIQLIKIVKEKHEELERKNESMMMMKDEINSMITNLNRSNSLLEKRNSDVYEIEERMNEQKMNFEKELEGKEEKIKLLEENLSQLRDEKVRMSNEKKASEGKGREEEVSLKNFYQEFQDFKTNVLTKLKHQDKEVDRPKNDNKKKEMPLLEEIAPWDALGNGFASKYMQKQGHQPGLGLGKMANGIVTQISAERRTFSTNKIPTWPKNIVLIAGDSMIGGVQEKRMSGKFQVKVRSHAGATTMDMRDHLSALLRKRPDHLILHAATNDAVDVDTCADDIFDRLMDLKAFAESQVPGKSHSVLSSSTN